ncbi:hypothetical protein QE197_18925 [Arsenophonus nasoniae]|nr:hypothetical protein [Arsenophonus nasoniae]WGL95497.1 hypothetical protein QE207_02385 [Arsenophonus nasoniae]WGM10762.1 hypothetical protein QE197_18925 [Arsenophonus nasoniae]WGM15469.1 hypothetical protein QE193_18815 [Arsenophonus nasoniae]
MPNSISGYQRVNDHNPFIERMATTGSRLKQLKCNVINVVKDIRNTITPSSLQLSASARYDKNFALLCNIIKSNIDIKNKIATNFSDQKKILDLGKNCCLKSERTAVLFNTLLAEIKNNSAELTVLKKNNFELSEYSAKNFAKAMHTLSYLYQRLSPENSNILKEKIVTSIFSQNDENFNLLAEAMVKVVEPKFILYLNQLNQSQSDPLLKDIFIQKNLENFSLCKEKLDQSADINNCIKPFIEFYLLANDDGKKKIIADVKKLILQQDEEFSQIAENYFSNYPCDSINRNVIDIFKNAWCHENYDNFSNMKIANILTS